MRAALLLLVAVVVIVWLLASLNELLRIIGDLLVMADDCDD